ncbi:hypothetical protein HDV00_008411 [Rhizophlyctis rosea]|nr:hypothetical protein HDV00_008411 [Rhizophlyctis rosea]
MHEATISNDSSTIQLYLDSKSRKTHARHNARLSTSRTRPSHHPEAHHWRFWAYGNGHGEKKGMRRALSCNCCPKKYVDRRRHGNHTCSGWMGDMCPPAHSQTVWRRREGLERVREWREGRDWDVRNYEDDVDGEDAGQSLDDHFTVDDHFAPVGKAQADAAESQRPSTAEEFAALSVEDTPELLEGWEVITEEPERGTGELSAGVDIGWEDIEDWRPLLKERR